MRSAILGLTLLAGLLDRSALLCAAQDTPAKSAMSRPIC